MELNWGYSTDNGPETWYKFFPNAAGERQSPIDIKPFDLIQLNLQKKLIWRYIPENSETVTNTGYGWKVEVNGKHSELSGGSLKDRYVLEQFHCHWGCNNNFGSEHTINGQTYSGELHLVHWNVKYKCFTEAAKYPDGLCVLGVFLKPGKSHRELDKIIGQFDRILYKNQSVKLGLPVDPGLLIPQDSNYWTYHGSLTTPPCSECVIWIVFKEPIEVSNKQLNAFRSLRSFVKGSSSFDDSQGFVKNNFRPTLPLGERKVKECLQ